MGPSGICQFVVAALLGSMCHWRVDPHLLGWSWWRGSLLEAVRVLGPSLVQRRLPRRDDLFLPPEVQGGGMQVTYA